MPATEPLVPAPTETAVSAVWSAPTASAIRQAARTMDDAGLSVIRVKGDGTKRPEGSWKSAQSVRFPGAVLSRMFPPGDTLASGYGVGVICGAVSGGLLMIEFEGAAVKEGWLARAATAAATAGLAEEWDDLMSGWVEMSPSGGLHLHVRVHGGACPGNLKLASRELRPSEMDERQAATVSADPTKTFPKIMVETRGEGGFAVRAPSGGTVHPSGKAYARVHGSALTIPVMPLEAVEGLLTALRSLNEYEPPAARARPAHGRTAPQVTPVDGQGLSPFDDYNDRADWEEILDGILFRSGTNYEGTELWTRLGKDPANGHSATIGFGGDILHVFSSSVSELPEGRSLNKAQAYTWLRFGAIDPAACSKAAKELRAAGYGSRPERDEFMDGGRTGPYTVDTEALVDQVESIPTPDLPGRLPGILARLRPVLRTDRAAAKVAVDRIGQAALSRGMSADEIREAIRNVLVEG